VTTNPTLLRRASIRSRENFLALLQMGVGAITIPPRLFAELLDRDPAFAAGRAFLYDARA
jgi:transaldolase